MICVVRREQQVQECKAAGATHVFNSTDKDFHEQLKSAAKQENATLAFDAVSGDLTGRVLAAMPYGLNCIDSFSHPPGSEIQVYGLLSLEKGESSMLDILNLVQLLLLILLICVLTTSECADTGLLTKCKTPLSHLMPSPKCYHCLMEN